ncbi:MAG: hypothetical protein J5J00_12785 [Deltaproteobacteria bacterium]|nr:hypothetical protein [Deltaproteobacteria bacterium]
MCAATLDDHFNALQDPLLLVDGNGAIVWSNRASVEQCGLSAGRMIAEALTPSAVRAILSCSGASVIETVQSGSDLAAIVTAVCGNGASPHFLVILTRNQAGILSLREREEALAGVAHDLKNPLGAIFGYADALLDTAAGEGLNVKQRDILARIRSTSSRSIELIRNYQHLAQLDALPQQSGTAKSELNSTIQSVLHYTWREDFERPKVEFKPGPQAIEVAIERLLLERVVANLYGNALKYTPPEGKIGITTAVQNSMGVMEIHNSLSVIPPDEISTIFNRYVRGSTSKGTPGSGLGLYIVKEILKKAGGSVHASSSPEVGTTFSLKLPIWGGAA